MRALSSMSTGELLGALYAPLSTAARIVVAAVGMIVGIGAVGGGWSLITDPAGMGADTAWLEGSMFTDFTVPGVVLLVVIGGGMLVTAALAVVGHRRAAAASVLMSIVLLGWSLVETVVIGYQGGPQIVLLAVFVLAPAAVLMTAGIHAARAKLRA